MQSLGLIAFVAGGIAIALLLIWRRARTARRADVAAIRRVAPGTRRPPKTVPPRPKLGREAAPQATALEVVATQSPTFKTPTGDLLVPDDRDPVPSSPAPQLDGQSGEDVVRSDGAAPSGDINCHRDQPTAPPGLIARDPQAIEPPTGDLSVPEDRDGVPSSPTPQLEARAGEDVVRTGEAALGDALNDHRDQVTAGPCLIATEPQASESPAGDLWVPEQPDAAPSSPHPQFDEQAGENPNGSDGAAPSGDVSDPGEVPVTSRDLDEELDQLVREGTTQAEKRVIFDTEGAVEPDKVRAIDESVVQSADSPLATALQADHTPVDDDVSEQPDEIDLETDKSPSATPAPKAPRQYRPPKSAPTLPVEKRTSPPAAVIGGEKRLDIKVRLVFERGGFCRLSLIPQKDERLDGEIAASSAAGAVELVPLQDDLYSDVFPADFGSALRDGLEWTAVSSSAKLRWTLAGREVYVLGPDEHLSGYLSMPRALLGTTQVVLCTDKRAAEVSAVIAASGSPQPTVIQQAEGLPVGWTGFGGVHPMTPIPQSSDHDILNVLRPRPDISIKLEGGIPIRRNTWLAEYPPQIHMLGIVPPDTFVLIDGIAATCNETGAYVMPGWDALGRHIISCADQTRTYEIAVGLETWRAWDAYRWSLEGIASDGVVSHPSTCGPLVRAWRSTTADPERQVVSARNSVIIGARPGDIALANMRGALYVSEGIASVSFDPVWALPSNPLLCDKSTARVIAMADQPVEKILPSGCMSQEELSARRAWCNAILDTARKRIPNDPDDPEVRLRWREYVRRAKALRKRLR